MLAKAMGAQVIVTSRRDDALARARELGADEAMPTGARLAERVDVAIETVGRAPWPHTLRSVSPEGRIVVAGASNGSEPPAESLRLAIREFTVMGSMMGSADELRALCRFVEDADLHPAVSRVYDGVEAVPDALRVLDAGAAFGSIVVRI